MVICFYLVEGNKGQRWNAQPWSNGQGEAVTGGRQFAHTSAMAAVQKAESCKSVTFEVKPDIMFTTEWLNGNWI